MRPKKKLALLGFDEDLGSRLAFVLRTNHYAVHVYEETSRLYVDCLGGVPSLIPDGIVFANTFLEPEMPGLPPSPATERSIRLIKNVAPYIPVLVLILGECDEETVLREPTAGDGKHIWRDDAAQLFQRLRILVARKRGPRKGVSSKLYISKVTGPISAVPASG